MYDGPGKERRVHEGEDGEEARRAVHLEGVVIRDL